MRDHRTLAFLLLLIGLSLIAAALVLPRPGKRSGAAVETPRRATARSLARPNVPVVVSAAVDEDNKARVATLFGQLFLILLGGMLVTFVFLFIRIGRRLQNVSPKRVPTRYVDAWSMHKVPDELPEENP